MKWVSYGKTCREFESEGLAILGTVVETEFGDILLVGDFSFFPCNLKIRRYIPCPAMTADNWDDWLENVVRNATTYATFNVLRAMKR